MANAWNTPSSKTSQPYNIEHLMSPSSQQLAKEFSLTPSSQEILNNFSLSPYFPTTSPYFNQTGDQPTYLNQGAGTQLGYTSTGFNPPFPANYRSGIRMVACPGGCKMSFVVGSDHFNQHLKEYHYLVNPEPRKMMRALHQKEKENVPGLVGAPVAPVLSCSGCYNECSTQEEARACAATHPEGTQLKCPVGCVDRSKKVVIFKTKATLQKHMREQHGRFTKTEESKMTYTCLTCDRTFGTKSNLKRHNNKFHEDETTARTTSSPVSTVTAITASTVSSTSSVPPISLGTSMSIVPPTSTVSTMSTVIMEAVPSTTITLSLMPVVPVVRQSSEVGREDQLPFSQKSYDSTEGLILSQ